MFVPSRGGDGNAQRLQHSVVGDETEFAALEADWNDLFARAEVQMPFLRYSWSRLCWERQRTIRGTRLFVVVVRDGQRPVLIAPLVARRSGLWRQDLSFLDSATPQYNDLLVASDDAPRYVSYLWQMLNNRPRARRFAASWVRDDSPLAPYLRAAAYEERSHEAPFIDLTKFETWEHYMQFLPMNLRRDHRKQVRRLERSGVAFAASDQQSFAKSIAWLFAQKRDWLERENMKIVQLQRRGKTHKWLSDPETEKLFAAMAKEGMDSGRVWVNTLGAADGTTVAACLCVREGSILYGSKIAYDPAWHSYSPERTLMLLNIERAFREGLQKVDLMIGGQSHKTRLATGVTMVWTRRIDLGSNAIAPPQLDL